MNWKEILTPIKSEVFKKLLLQSGYDTQKTNKLIQGFTQGFDVGYQGPSDRQDTSKNLPIRDGARSICELWNKVMNEVQLNRYAGPFEKPPMKNFIQSPIGLVPKAGNKTRLTFHLSYDKVGELSHTQTTGFCVVQ